MPAQAHQAVAEAKQRMAEHAEAAAAAAEAAAAEARTGCEPCLPPKVCSGCVERSAASCNVSAWIGS